MALVPQASGSEALGFWARRLASSTQRLVRRRSPRSASANSLTAQLVVSERLRPDSLGNGLILGCYEVLRPQHTPRASKTKNVGNWQAPGVGGRAVDRHRDAGVARPLSREPADDAPAAPGHLSAGVSARLGQQDLLHAPA